MLAIILLVIAALCFFAAAIGQTIVEQPPLDLAYWGLLFVVAALLVGQPLIAKRIGRGE